MKTNTLELIDLSDSMSGFNLEESKNLTSYIGSFKKDIIKILYIGQSFQDIFLLPYLKQTLAIRRDLHIEVYCVDAIGSKDMFRKDTFKHNRQELDFFLNRNTKYVSYFNGEKEVDLNSKEYLPEKLKKLFGENEPILFDTIFCCFELHFCLNWRYSLINILKLLNNSGNFVFSEISGTLSLLDGNFPPEKPSDLDYDKFEIFLKAFEEVRSKYHYWKPEISFTNYKEVVFFIKHFFDKGLDEHISEDLSPSLIIDKENFLDYFNNGKLGYFSIGLDKLRRDEYKKLNEVIEDKWDIEPQNLSKDITLFIAYGFNTDSTEGQKHINWNYSTFSKDIQEIHDFKVDALTQKALDVLISHDVIFPEGTLYLSIISWIGDDYSWRYPMSVVRNQRLLAIEKKLNTSNLTLKKFQRLLALEHYFGKSILDFLFKGRKEKFTIIFQLHEAKGGNHLFIADNIFSNNVDKDVWIGYHLKKNRKGKFQKLTIGCSQKFIIDFIINGSKFTEAYQALESEYYDHRQITESISKVTLKEDFKYFVSNTFKKQKKKNFNLEGTNDDKINELLSQLNQALKSTDNTLGDQYITRDLLLLVYKSFLYKPNYQISIYPAGLPETRNDKHIKGLGILLYEKNPPVNNKILLQQIMARDKVLRRVTNLMFQRTASIYYVNQDFKEKSRKAAIAAISARNFSHNLGSHVIPKIFAKNMSELKKSYLLKFIDYIQQRNDFINQLTSVGGGWTMSTWFVKDLMAKFYQQFYLLDYIANYEGISAYCYDGYPRRKPIYKEYEFNELSKKPNKKFVILFGYLSIESQSQELFFSPQYMRENDEALKKIKCGFDWNKIKEGKHKELIHELLQSVKNDKTQVIEKLKAQIGRPFKMYGELIRTENKDIKLFSIHGFIENNLVLKVRRRRFLKLIYSSDGKCINHELQEVSSFLNKREKICYNLSKFQETGETIWGRIKEQRKKDNRPQEQYHYFGIIKKIEENSLFLTCELGDTPSPHYSTTEYSSVVQIIIPDLRELLKDDYIKKLITLGKRIIVKGTLKEIVAVNPEKIKPTGQPFYITDAQVLEIVKIDYLVSPTSQFRPHDSYDLMNDLKVAIPGGISGYQAFYTILENIIRNGAKHDWVLRSVEEKIGRNLEVKIEIEDQNDPDHYICKIWTNTNNLKLNQRNNAKLNEELNSFIEEDIIENSGDFIHKHLGVSEIKINAAFLYSKSGLITDKSKLKGGEILLQEKIENFDESLDNSNLIKGFLRASRIMEYENEEIHERLGYRFKLQKPKELLVISENKEFENLAQKYDLDIRDLQGNVIDNNSVLDREKRGNLDYEFCLVLQGSLIEKREEQLCLPQLLTLFFTLIFNKIHNNNSVIREDEEIKKTFDEIFDKLEKYPYRFFWANKENSQKEETRYPTNVFQMILKIRNNKLAYSKYNYEASLKKKILFLKRRIIILSRNELNLLFSISNSKKSDTLISKGQIFKLLLYDKWIRIFEREFYRDKSFILNVDMTPDDSESKLLSPPTVPFNLRYNSGDDNSGDDNSESNDNRLKRYSKSVTREKLNINKSSAEIFFERFLELQVMVENVNELKSFLFNNRYPLNDSRYKKENRLILLYKRHKSIKKALGATGGRESIYSEELSGKKLSFPQFSILNNISYKKRGYEYYKFMFQLFENAHPNILILDERIIEFQSNLKDENIKFLNANLIIPYSLKIRDLKNFSVEGKKYKPEKISNLFNYEKSIGNIDIKYQYIYPEYLKEKTPQINTVIIHQSILERILRLEDNSKGANKIQEIIQEIKFEIPSLIITSGKGKTEDYSEFAKYLPFSTLKDLIMSKSPDKTLLNQVLFKTLK